MLSEFNRFIFSCTFFLYLAEGWAMTPNDMNNELPIGFEKNMPEALVKCVDCCVNSDFSKAAAHLIKFAGTYRNFFHSELVSIEQNKPSERGTRKLLEENYEAIKNLYQKEGTPYDHAFELEAFVRSGFLGALYWDYSSMVSDLMFKMNELKKKPGFNEFMSILIDTIEQPERPLLEIINDKVI